MIWRVASRPKVPKIWPAILPMPFMSCSCCFSAARSARSAAFCSSGEALKPIASEWLAARTSEERALLRSSSASLSPELDRSLLHCAKGILGRFLTDEEKIRLRALVRAQAESD